MIFNYNCTQSADLYVYLRNVSKNVHTCYDLTFHVIRWIYGIYNLWWFFSQL